MEANDLVEWTNGAPPDMGAPVDQGAIPPEAMAPADPATELLDRLSKYVPPDAYKTLQQDQILNIINNVAMEATQKVNEAISQAMMAASSAQATAEMTAVKVEQMKQDVQAAFGTSQEAAAPGPTGSSAVPPPPPGDATPANGEGTVPPPPPDAAPPPPEQAAPPPPPEQPAPPDVSSDETLKDVSSDTLIKELDTAIKEENEEAAFDAIKELSSIIEQAQEMLGAIKSSKTGDIDKDPEIKEQLILDKITGQEEKADEEDEEWEQRKEVDKSSDEGLKDLNKLLSGSRY